MGLGVSVPALAGPIGFGDILIFLVGLAFGSFGGMLSSRIPDKKAFTGRSQCLKCGSTLGPMELVPVFSYIIQGGRCKHCRERISPAYMLVELCTALSFVLIYRQFGIGAIGILNMVCALHFAVLAGTDMMHGLLPNVVIISGSAFALILRIVSPLTLGKTTEVLPRLLFSASLRDGLLGALLGFGFFFVVALVKPGAMGGGDIKMAAFIGLYVGAAKVFPALGLGFVLSSLYAIPLMVTGRLKRTDTLPLGIFLSIATLVMVLVRF